MQPCLDQPLLSLRVPLRLRMFAWYYFVLEVQDFLYDLREAYSEDFALSLREVLTYTLKQGSNCWFCGLLETDYMHFALQDSDEFLGTRGRRLCFECELLSPGLCVGHSVPSCGGCLRREWKFGA